MFDFLIDIDIYRIILTKSCSNVVLCATNVIPFIPHGQKFTLRNTVKAADKKIGEFL